MSRHALSSFVWTAQQAGNHPRGVVDHRDDSGVVHAGRPDHADGADDPAAARPLLVGGLIGGHDHRAPGHAEQLVLGADEDLYPLGALDQLDQAQQVLFGLEQVEQRADPLEVGKVGDVLEQLGVAAHDQHAFLGGLIVAPQREAGFDHLAGQAVGLALAFPDLAFDLLARVGERAAGQTRGQISAGLDEGGRADPDRNVDEAIFDHAVVSDPHDQSAARLSRTNSTCLNGRSTLVEAPSRQSATSRALLASPRIVSRLRPDPAARPSMSARSSSLM